jgi:hypothetical protein
MVSLDQFRGVDLSCGFPCVVTFGVSFPLYEVLERARPSMTSVAEDTLHFILLFSVDKVRWWSGEVFSVCCGFAIREEKGCMEDVVYVPGTRELELVRHRGNLFEDFERSVAFGG